MQSKAYEKPSEYHNAARNNCLNDTLGDLAVYKIDDASKLTPGDTSANGKYAVTANGIDVEFNQDNHSKSSAHVLRGLHFQKAPYAQAKLVRCTRGRIYDVAVDIRKDSPTCGQYVKVELSEDNKHMLFIPEGFAHGFVVLSDEAELIYKASGEYAPKADCGIIWNDKDININWEIDFEPVLSEKDIAQKTFKEIIGV